MIESQSELGRNVFRVRHSDSERRNVSARFQIGPHQSASFKNSHPGVGALPRFTRRRNIQAERGNVLCDNFGDAVLRLSAKLFEIVEHLRT